MSSAVIKNLIQIKKQTKKQVQTLVELEPFTVYADKSRTRLSYCTRCGVSRHVANCDRTALVRGDNTRFSVKTLLFVSEQPCPVTRFVDVHVTITYANESARRRYKKEMAFRLPTTASRRNAVPARLSRREERPYELARVFRPERTPCPRTYSLWNYA